MTRKVVLAIAAHPDDIEFVMAGTLLLLREAGWSIHYLNIANGCCGSMTLPPRRIAAVRRIEARNAAKVLGARFYDSLCNDLEIFYEIPLLRRVAAIVREAAPSVVLTHSPQDYMEDHMNAARLAVTAAFVRSVPNFLTQPRRGKITSDITVYHALPHGLRDGLNRRIFPESFVDVSSVHATKLKSLAAHRSQHEWLDATQGMSSYLRAMEDLSREVGAISGKFRMAEGWRRHSHLGFCAADADPLRDALGGRYRLNPTYARWLEGAAPPARKRHA